jgi:hypothetical protein
LPPSQQVGSPQQGLKVAAGADRDISITAAITNDKALIFINSPLSSFAEERHGRTESAMKWEKSYEFSLNSQIVFELKNGRLIT